MPHSNIKSIGRVFHSLFKQFPTEKWLHGENVKIFKKNMGNPFTMTSLLCNKLRGPDSGVPKGGKLQKRKNKL